MNEKSINLLLVIGLVLLGVLAFTPIGESQLGGQCATASEYHSWMAGQYSHRLDQAYHLGAVEAYDYRAAKGYSCTGWDQDASPPTLEPNGAMTQGGATR